MKKIYSLVIFVFCVCFIVSGCGYTIRGFTSKYKTVHVNQFKNSVDITSESSEHRRYASYFPLLESTLTQRIVDRFIFDSSIKVAKEDEAQAILSGELTAYRREPLRYAANNEDVVEYRVIIFVNISLYDKEKGGVAWSKSSFSGDATYETTGPHIKSEREALSDAVDDLARRVVEAVVEGGEW